jgi:hypothetical protein
VSLELPQFFARGDVPQRTVLSAPADAIHFPSGDTATAITQPT